MPTYPKVWKVNGAIIRQRGCSYQVETHHNGKRTRQTFKAVAATENYAKQVKAELKAEGDLALAINHATSSMIINGAIACPLALYRRVFAFGTPTCWSSFVESFILGPFQMTSNLHAAGITGISSAHLSLSCEVATWNRQIRTRKAISHLTHSHDRGWCFIIISLSSIAPTSAASDHRSRRRMGVRRDALFASASISLFPIS